MVEARTREQLNLDQALECNFDFPGWLQNITLLLLTHVDETADRLIIGVKLML